MQEQADKKNLKTKQYILYFLLFFIYYSLLKTEQGNYVRGIALISILYFLIAVLSSKLYDYLSKKFEWTSKALEVISWLNLVTWVMPIVAVVTTTLTWKNTQQIKTNKWLYRSFIFINYGLSVMVLSDTVFHLNVSNDFLLFCFIGTLVIGVFSFLLFRSYKYKHDKFSGTWVVDGNKNTNFSLASETQLYGNTVEPINKPRKTFGFLGFAILGLLTAVAVFSLYWFSARPNALRKDCYSQTKDITPRRRQDWEYEKCLRSKGLQSNVNGSLINTYESEIEDLSQKVDGLQYDLDNEVGNRENQDQLLQDIEEKINTQNQQINDDDAATMIDFCSRQGQAYNFSSGICE